MLLGPSGVAILEIGRQMVGVVQTLMLGMANYWQPILSRSVAKNTIDTFVRDVVRATLNQTVIGTLSIIILLTTLPYLLPLFFADKAVEYINSIQVAWII